MELNDTLGGYIRQGADSSNIRGDADMLDELCFATEGIAKGGGWFLLLPVEWEATRFWTLPEERELVNRLGFACLAQPRHRRDLREKGIEFGRRREGLSEASGRIE
jgi:hypothetical protein